MNIQHSSRSDLWQTPDEIIRLVYLLFPGIELDPASDEKANQRIRANRIITREQDALSMPWEARSVYLNPPGGKAGNKSLVGLFWRKLLHEVSEGNVGHALFMAFSAEALQHTQGKGGKSICDYPFCVPSRRIRFVHPVADDKVSPSHSNVICYVPGYVDETASFHEIFSVLGAVCVPYLACIRHS